MKGLKLLALTIISILICSVSFAQSATVKWGATIKKPSGTYISKIVGEDKDGFYVLRKALKKGVMHIERFNQKMELEFSQQLTIPKKGKKFHTYEGIYYINNQLVLFTSFADKNMGKNFAFAHPISDKGVVGTKFKKIDEIKTEGRKTGSFDVELSKDSTKFLVYHNEPYDKYEDEEFSFKVYDNTLTPVWEKGITLPYKDENFNIKDYKIAGNGTVYMLATIYPDKSKGEKTKSKEYQVNKYVILSYNGKDDDLQQFEVNLSGKWIDEMSYEINEETQELIVSGFYADDHKMAVKGTFFLSMDIESKKVKVTSIKAFDKEFISESIGEKKAEKGKGIRYFDFDYMFTRKDGGIYMVAEQYYLTTRTYTDSNGNTRTVTVYNYDDIMVTSINSKGEIEWTRLVEKRTGSSGPAYLSYAVNFNKNNDQLNIVFNDNPENISRAKDDTKKIKALKSYKKSIAALVNINIEGYMSRTAMFQNRDLDKTYLRPSLFLSTDDESFITVATRGKNYKFGKFTFK